VKALAKVGLAVLLLVVVAGAPPAHATIFERGFDGPFEETVEDEICGIAVVRHSEFSRMFVTRTGKGELDQAFFGHDNFHFADTFTTAEGASFSITGKGVFKDVNATPQGGDIFEFRVLEASTIRLLDSDGNVILRDRGAIWRTILFDTLGDSRPGGITLEEQVTGVSGPHPLFDMDEESFCAIVEGLLG
jgi:hypothetical protein